MEIHGPQSRFIEEEERGSLKINNVQPCTTWIGIYSFTCRRRGPVLSRAQRVDSGRWNGRVCVCLCVLVPKDNRQSKRQLLPMRTDPSAAALIPFYTYGLQRTSCTKTANEQIKKKIKSRNVRCPQSENKTNEQEVRPTVSLYGRFVVMLCTARHGRKAKQRRKRRSERLSAATTK